MGDPGGSPRARTRQGGGGGAQGPRRAIASRPMGQRLTSKDNHTHQRNEIRHCWGHTATGACDSIQVDGGRDSSITRILPVEVSSWRVYPSRSIMIVYLRLTAVRINLRKYPGPQRWGVVWGATKPYIFKNGFHLELKLTWHWHRI
jgi:hypothetical protein